MSLLKTRNKVVLKTPPWGTYSLSIFLRLLVLFTWARDFLFIRYWEIHWCMNTSCSTAILEFQAEPEPIFPDLIVYLFHVYPHHQSVLFLLAILNILGNLGHQVFSGTVLLKACLLLSDDVVHGQMPYQPCVDHPFHEFAHTTGQADRTVVVCVCLVYPSCGWAWYHVSCQMVNLWLVCRCVSLTQVTSMSSLCSHSVSGTLLL